MPPLGACFLPFKTFLKFFTVSLFNCKNVFIFVIVERDRRTDEKETLKHF